MDNYDKICPLGEGTYGMVMKCRHRETGRIVAIKKFKDSDEDDPQIRKTALREVKMLKHLKNEHIVNLLEVFRRRGKLYLVFEHLDHTILEDLEKYPRGMPDDPSSGDLVRKVMWQLIKAISFLHSNEVREMRLEFMNKVIHRDLKPENILVSTNGVLKLCDFGFARTLNGPGARYTDYVATRWYRAPELLVGDAEYGKSVDIWALGCIFAEILSGQPLFPGDTDIDQLYRIMKNLGPLIKRHTDVFARNPYFINCKIPEVTKLVPLRSKFGYVSQMAMDVLESCLVYEPIERATVESLKSSQYFTRDGFSTTYETSLKRIYETEKRGDPAFERRKKRDKRDDYKQRRDETKKDDSYQKYKTYPTIPTLDPHKLPQAPITNKYITKIKQQENALVLPKIGGGGLNAGNTFNSPHKFAK